MLGFLALGRGRATDHLAEAATLGEGMRELQRISPAWWGLAESALRSGDPAAAVRWCERGFEASARVRDAAYLYPYVVTGVRAYLASSGATEARDWLTRAGGLVRERGIPGTLGALDHGLGLIHLQEGQTGKARIALAAAAGFWARRRRFWEGTQALLDQARCATRSRRPGEAALFAAHARQAAAAVGAVFEVPASQPAEIRPVVEGILTARESEIARVVALGMTNKEIAAALMISPKTVAAHVEHILAKLGFARRAQIAAWATMQG